MIGNGDAEGKRERLRRAGLLNRKPERVADPLFRRGAFFDPADLLQVRYEMVRAARCERGGVTAVAQRFGVSRKTCARSMARFEKDGLPGLLPAKRGPRAPHKITPEVLRFIVELRERHGRIGARRLVPLVEAEFGLRLHPRAIEKALERRQKKMLQP